MKNINTAKAEFFSMSPLSTIDFIPIPSNDSLREL